MSNRLPMLAKTAADAHAAVGKHGIAAAEAVLTAGSALAEAKDSLRHGTWLPWLNSTGISERTAQRYILLHRGGCKSAILAYLGQEVCARYSSLGLRLWPSNERAYQAALHAENADYLAIWHLDTATTRYGLVKLAAGDRSGDWFGVYKPIGSPWLLGKIHEEWMGVGAAVVSISPSEALETLNEMAAAQ